MMLYMFGSVYCVECVERVGGDVYDMGGNLESDGNNFGGR